MNEFPPDLKMALTESAYGFANEHRHQDPYYRQQQDLNIELYRSAKRTGQYRRRIRLLEGHGRLRRPAADDGAGIMK